MSIVFRDQSNSEFFQLLNKLMKNDDFRELLDKYGNTWLDMKTLIMYIKTYELIEREYYNIYQQELDENMMTNILFNVFTNKDTRKLICNTFNDFTYQMKSRSYLDHFIEQNSKKKIEEKNASDISSIQS